MMTKYLLMVALVACVGCDITIPPAPVGGNSDASCPPPPVETLPTYVVLTVEPGTEPENQGYTLGEAKTACIANRMTIANVDTIERMTAAFDACGSSEFGQCWTGSAMTVDGIVYPVAFVFNAGILFSFNGMPDPANRMKSVVCERPVAP